MDDDLEDTGLSGWAWFQLGHMAAEHFQSMRETADGLKALFYPGNFTTVEDVRAENASLIQNLDGARADTDALQSENETLRAAWQDLRSQLGQRDQELQEVMAHLAAVEAAYDEHRGTFDELYRDYQARGDECVLLDGFLKEIGQQVEPEGGIGEPEKVLQTIKKILADLAAMRV